MRHIILRRSIALLLSIVLLLSGFPVFAASVETEAESVQPESRAAQTIAQRAQTLKTKIQSLPTAGGERNARVDLTDFAPTAAEGDPIFGLRGKYYVAYLPDNTTAMVLDGSWGDSLKEGPLPTVPVAVDGARLDTGSLSTDISFTLLPADIFSNLGMGRHVFAFANSTLSVSLTNPVKEVYQLAQKDNHTAALAADSIPSAPRIITKSIPEENKMVLLYSTGDGMLFGLQTVPSETAPSFDWVRNGAGDSFGLYRIWSTVDLQKAITNAASLLNTPDSYVVAEYENFLTCLEESVATFQAYNDLPTDLMDPYIYPQEEMDRLTHELESYKTLLNKNLTYIDIPVEIIDFRSDGYLFENTVNYAFRFDKRDAENEALGQSIQKDILSRFGNLPDLPGHLADPNSVSGANNMRVGLTEKSLVNGKLVYHPDTIIYMAHSLCKKESNNSAALSYYVPGFAKTLHQHIYETFYVPYTNSNATEEQKAAILGSWEQTLEKIGGVNGNPLTWAEVETAHDAAYYLLTYLWQSVPETDTFYYSGSTVSPDPYVANQKDNRYNMVVTQRDTLRLYSDAKGIYNLNASKQMGYSGRYAFNTSATSSLIKGIKPRFAPIDGLGFEEPGVMKNLLDTDPGSGRVVIEGHNGYDSNYNFSMHASGSFVYYEDQDLFFTFNGDDDVYFFIDGYLALDIGSSHAAKKGTCYLNEFKDENGNPLVNGQIYTFDMFYTERATPDSNLAFSTNIKIVDNKALTTKGQYLEKHGMENRADSKTGFGIELEENAMVAIGDTVAYSFELLNTRTVPLTDVSFTDNTLGVAISKDSLTLCDPANNYALTNGAKTEISDIVVTYRTYDEAAGVHDGALTMVSYSTMLSRIREATVEPTEGTTQFTRLTSGSYGVKISSEAELKTLLELGIPVNCQMAVYGFKRIMSKDDRPYQNILQSLAHYQRVSVEGTGLVYGDPLPVSGTADRTLRVPDPSSITPPTAEAERYVIDYNKPVELSLTDLTKHVYSNRLVSVGNLVGFVSEGANGTVLRRAPESLYCEKATGGRTMETAHGTVTRNGDKLTYTLNGFLSEIDRFYGVVEISGLYARSEDGREYPYPYILVEIQIIPASIMYYETNLAAGEFSNESGGGLYFDFKNDPADLKRYDSSIYSHANFDDTSLIRWVGNMPDIRVDNGNEGTLTVNAKYISDPNATKGMYVDPSAAGSARDFPLRYTLTGKDVFEIRFKMENFTSPNSKPYVALHPTFDGRNSIVDDTKVSMYFDTEYLTNGTYYTATISLSETSYKYTYLSSLRAYFGSVNSQSEAVPGTLTIDYIYVGPADKTPVGEHLYFNFTNREADQNRYNTFLYGNGNFYNYDTPTAWRHRSYTMELNSVDNEAEHLVLTTLDQESLDTRDNEIYIQASPGINSNLNMNYHPKEGDVLKIRFRMSNIKQAEGKYFALRFAFHTDRKEVSGVSPLYSFSNHNYSYTYPVGSTEGEYKELTIDLWENSTYHKDLLTSFRLTFCGISIEDESKGTGKIEIDYIYIGSEEDFTQMEGLYSQNWQTVTDGTSHTGELQETDFVNRTVYDMEKCGEDQRFFIGFDDTDEDRTRYASAVYNNKNRDLSTNWSKSGGVFDHRTDNDAGLYKLMAKASLAANEFPAVYQDLTNLSFNPAKAEVYQVRFKMENFIVPQVNNQPDPYIDLHYKTGSSAWLKIAGENWVKYFDAEYASNGQFVTLTLDLTEEFRSAPSIHTMRFFFGNIQSPGDSTNGILSIDYIYIGPRDRAPADTVYGYDPSYNNDTRLSNGSSVYVEGTGVRLSGKETDYTETLFSFTGTGFDIISRTGSQQGTIRVSVFSDPERTNLVKGLTVNNKGELELYQIPVASVQGLPHGTYYVTLGVNKKITGSPMGLLDRGNQFYFDAIRIYDPIDTTENTDVHTVYKLDKEANAFIKEIRNILLTSEEFASLFGSQEGAVFIDSFEKESIVLPNPETGKPEEVSDPSISIDDHYALNVQTYNKVGPKNEVYLSPGQAVAFRLQVHGSQTPASLDIGAKTITGKAAKLVAGIVTSTNDMDAVLTVASRTEIPALSTATAMYYPLVVNDTLIPPKSTSCYIVLYNATEETPTDRNGDLVISLTDIKVAYEGAATKLPEDQLDDPEIMKRSPDTSAPVSFLVDGNTAEAAAVFLRKELSSLPLIDSHTKLFHSLDLASSIALNYAVAKTELENCTDIYMEVRIPKYSGNTLLGTEVLRLEPVEKGDYYYFTLADLTAVAMNDVLEATLSYTCEGQTYIAERDTYSIAQYAYSQLSKEGVREELKTLCADLLRYGAKAQLFKDYRTDSLADSLMTEAHRAYLSDLDTVTFGNTNRVLNDLENAPITWAGKALNLESKVALNFVFNPANYEGDLSDLTLRISYKDISGGTKLLTIENPERYNEAMGYYVFTLDTLLAAELRTAVSVQIYAGDTPASCTMEYSADTYGNNKTGTLGELCKALFAYSDSAKDYFVNT